MSENQDNPHRQFAVMLTSLQKFMAAHRRFCNVCGKDDWIIPLEPDFEDGDPMAIVQMAGLQGFGIRSSIPVHTLVCKGCGNVQLISAAHVRGWVEENE